jgi:LEA14-like dessication related protein
MPISRLLIWIYLFVSFLLTGCGGLPINSSQFVKPKVRIADIRMLDSTLFEQRFAIKLRVQNPNNFSIPVNGLNYQINLNGSAFGSGVNNHTFTIPRNAETLVDVDLTTSLPDMMKALSGWMKNKDTLTYAILGNLNVGGRNDVIPFDYSGELNLNALTQ